MSAICLVEPINVNAVLSVVASKLSPAPINTTKSNGTAKPDFVPLALIDIDQMILVVAPSLRAKSND